MDTTPHQMQTCSNMHPKKNSTIKLIRAKSELKTSDFGYGQFCGSTTEANSELRHLKAVFLQASPQLCGFTLLHTSNRWTRTKGISPCLPM